jgi:hypothetical protein
MRVEEQPRPVWMMHWTRATLRAQLMSCLPVGAHGRGVVLRTVEPPAITGQPGQARWASGGAEGPGQLCATARPTSWALPS